MFALLAGNYHKMSINMPISKDKALYLVIKSI